jgi:hypothetical protein
MACADQTRPHAQTAWQIHERYWHNQACWFQQQSNTAYLRPNYNMHAVDKCRLCLPHPLPAAAGTFSYITEVYGASNMDSNFLCNGLSHGGSWLWTVVCQNKLGNIVGSYYAGFAPGTAAAVGAMVNAYNAYCSATQTCAGIFCR